MRDAVTHGVVGVEGLLSVIGPLGRVGLAAGRAAQLNADAELAAAARGEGVDAAPPASADHLRALATDLALFLDQDIAPSTPADGRSACATAYPK